MNNVYRIVNQIVLGAENQFLGFFIKKKVNSINKKNP